MLGYDVFIERGSTSHPLLRADDLRARRFLPDLDAPAFYWIRIL